MLSNKSQYILSKIGILLFEEATSPLIEDETAIYFFQKDNILTLHRISVDEYTEKERNLLDGIIAAIQDTPYDLSQGIAQYSETEAINFNEIVENMSNIKATLVFFDAIKLKLNIDYIQSSTLKEMLLEPNLKKDLWVKLKPITLS
jgi:hypothetical protein